MMNLVPRDDTLRTDDEQLEPHLSSLDPLSPAACNTLVPIICATVVLLDTPIQPATKMGNEAR
jgi:hypothetical protein